jgi:DNA-binding transcriptional regulator YiaG
MTGREVRRTRKLLGLSQPAFAEKVGVTAMTVSRWERGVLTVGSTAAILIRLLADLARQQKREDTK